MLTPSSVESCYLDSAVLSFDGSTRASDFANEIQQTLRVGTDFTSVRRADRVADVDKPLPYMSISSGELYCTVESAKFIARFSGFLLSVTSTGWSWTCEVWESAD
jgi:hypothetical protein